MFLSVQENTFKINSAAVARERRISQDSKQNSSMLYNTDARNVICCSKQCSGTFLRMLAFAVNKKQN